MSFSKVYRVLHKTGHPHSVLLESKELEEGLLLESGTVVSLTQAEKDEIRTGYSKVFDAYGCLGAIKFPDDTTGTKHSFYLILVTAYMSVGKVLDCEIFRITGVCFYSLGNGSVDNDSRCSDLKKLLSSGKFYLSWSPKVQKRKDCLDITVCLQNQGQKDEQERFFWNRLMHVHFKHFRIDTDLWLFRIMSGGIDIKTVFVGAQQAKAMVISRLSCERAGTRFNVRGVDDEANVANFVESEQVIVIGNNISSFMQVRGSIPLFWEQPGLNVGSHKVRMARGFEATAPTYNRHLRRLVELYGQCAIINLLGSKEGENTLSGMFQNHHEQSEFHKSIPFLCFDYHAECRGKSDNLSKLKSKIWDKVEEFGFYTKRDDQNLRLTQTGVLRINCLDCLDRTNSTKTYFGLQMLSKQLEQLGLSDNKQLEDRFREAFKSAWPTTGDLISRMYAGTGALEGKTKLKDGARSVSRAIQNNFLDQNKQNAIDLLIHGTNSLDIELASRASNLLSGDCLQAPVAVLKGMCDKYKDFSAEMPVRVAVGTWNVNGGKHFRSIAYKDQTLDDWLLNIGNIKESSGEKYKALYDFPREQDGDLPFVSGDIITVHKTLDEGQWMSGECNGEVGIFPSAYVAKVYPTYKALFDFPAQQDGDLDFVCGDIIEVTEMSGDWWKGKVKLEEYDPDAIEGAFPASYVEKYNDSSTAAISSTPDSTHVDWNKPMDIYAIGFQEMVELSAGNIVNTSTTNHQVWATELEKTLSGKYKYILLASEQLVGVCLYVFIRPQHAPHIRDLEISAVKTGMGGATGNKGGIGIRMQFYNSSICFICSHLAAGQGQVNDRNSDFAEICKKMTFSNNKGIYCHDYIFWCGDLNYRIDMPIDDVKQLVKDENWSALREFDQLCVEKKEKRVFQLFKEGKTNFAPTYKYDLFSDVYDTSEKSRTPAWTDRVLWFRRQWFSEKQGDDDLVSVTENHDFNYGKLLYYGRAEIKTSDHRPVIAVLDIDVLQCNEEHIDATFDETVAAQGPPDASIFVSLSETGNDVSPMDAATRTAMLAELGKIGDIILTRQLKSKLLVIFKEGTSAVEAQQLNGTYVNGVPIYVSMKSVGWKEEFENELRHRSHSASFNESFASHHATETVHYDYPPDAFDTEYDENQNYTEPTDKCYGQYPDEKEVPYECAEQDIEVVNDPGWACEETYSTPAYETYQESPPQDVPLPQKAPVPPRPVDGPSKKRPPPRPSTLPSMPIGPPPKPANVPNYSSETQILKPSTAVHSSENPGLAILIPEPAPLITKPPKITPRTTVPKRRAPRPPPNKAPVLVTNPRLPPGQTPVQPKRQPLARKAPVPAKPSSHSLKPKRAPPLPQTAPKGPRPMDTLPVKNKAAAHSSPNLGLLDFDPFGPLAEDLQSANAKSAVPTLLPSKTSNIDSFDLFNAKPNPKSTTSKQDAQFRHSQSSQDLFGQDFFANFETSNDARPTQTAQVLGKALTLKPVSITPPPISSAAAGTQAYSWMSQRSNSLRPTSMTPPPVSSNQMNIAAPRRSSATPTGQGAKFSADDWLNSTLTKMSTTTTAPNAHPQSGILQPSRTPASSVQPQASMTAFTNLSFKSQPQDPFGIPKPAHPSIPTSVLNNGSTKKQLEDPFGMFNLAQTANSASVLKKGSSKTQTNDPFGMASFSGSLPENDPWQSAASGKTITNSFSTDFSGFK